MENFIKSIENENDNECLNYTVCSKAKLSKEIVFILIYPGRYIPVCDNGELTGSIDKEKVKKIPTNKLKNLTVQQIKEHAPYTALFNSSESILKREMIKKRIEYVFLINKQYQFKGVFSVELPKINNKPATNVFDRLFDITLKEAKIA